MAFRFPLQALLRVRQSREERERRRLALLNAQIGRLHQENDILNRERLLAWTQIFHGLKAGMSGAELQFEMASMATRAYRQEELRKQIVKLQQERIVQERLFREAQKHRKILDSLRERKLRDYLQVRARQEQQQVDDLFMVSRTSASRS
jgi:flagellar export protein FliJ